MSTENLFHVILGLNLHFTAKIRSVSYCISFKALRVIGNQNYPRVENQFVIQANNLQNIYHQRFVLKLAY